MAERGIEAPRVRGLAVARWLGPRLPTPVLVAARSSPGAPHRGGGLPSSKPGLCAETHDLRERSHPALRRVHRRAARGSHREINCGIADGERRAQESASRGGCARGPRAAGGASDKGQGAVGCERVNAPAHRDADSKVSSRPAVTIGPVSRRGSAKTAGTPTSLAGWRPETDQRTTASSSRRRPLRSRAPRARARPAHLRPRRRAPARPRRSRAHHVRAAR